MAQTAMQKPLFHFLRVFALCCSLSLISACTGLSPRTEEAFPERLSLQDFYLEGRFSLRQGNDNSAGRISWRHEGSKNNLLLSSPLGQGMAEISTDPMGARLLTHDGRLYESPDVESLTRQILGYPLPLERLTRWVRGEHGNYDKIEHDSLGRILRFRHEGWAIDYEYGDKRAESPPDRIFIERIGEFELRLKIDTWESLAPKNGQGQQ